ncbi:hypothetical protein BC830DRAFT_957659 [Chytriomyces sp. MP71]|nr:hypothetical protein BC830DRAFT_957659 [Chytriomyces sp. MP71]
MEQRIEILEAESARLRSAATAEPHTPEAPCATCLAHQDAKQSLELRVAALSNELRKAYFSGPSSPEASSSNSTASIPSVAVQLPSFDASMDGLFGDEGSSLLRSIPIPSLLPQDKPAPPTPLQVANISAIDIYGIPDVEELRKSLIGLSSLPAKLVDDHCSYFLALISTRNSEALKRAYMCYIRSYQLINDQASAEDKPGIFLHEVTFFTKTARYFVSYCPTISAD